MKAVVFGDCHAARVWEHHKPNTLPFELKIWGKAGEKIHKLDLETMLKEDLASTGVEDGRNVTFDPIVTFKEFEDADVICPWLGYVDIRLFLHRYNNADDLAKDYVEKIMAFFPGKKYLFIEPLPQFKQMILKYEGISPSYPYSERQRANDQFVAALRKYCKLHGLPEPISQQEIFDAIGTQELTVDMTHDKAPHPVDGLRDEFNEKIYNLFVSRISDIIK